MERLWPPGVALFACIDRSRDVCFDFGYLICSHVVHVAVVTSFNFELSIVPLAVVVYVLLCLTVVRRVGSWPTLFGIR